MGRRRVLLCRTTGTHLAKAGSRLSRGHTRRLAVAAGPLASSITPVLRPWRAMLANREDQTASPDQRKPPRVALRRSHPRSPLPPGSPLPTVAQTYLFWRDAHAYLDACHRRYGSTFTVKPLQSPPLVFTSSPEAIHAIFRAPADVLHPGQGGAVIEPLVGSSSFMLADQDAHVLARRAITPAFSHSAVQDHTHMVEEIAIRQVARWPRSEPFAAHPRLRALTLAVILRTLFGERDLDELHRVLLSMFDITARVVLQEAPLRRLPGGHGAWKRFLAARAQARTLLARLTADALNDGNESLPAMIARAQASSTDTTSPEEIHDNLMSLILAGHETTASQLAWALQLLAHSPHIQTTLATTIDNGEQTYLTATIQEVLRHRNVFLFAIPRVVNKPIQIEQHTYRPPVNLLPCIHLIHHDPDIYDQPHQFLPERFLDQAPPHEHWLPWGGGRRRCPGRHLATLEMQIVLRTLLAQATVLPVSPRLETARWRTVILTPEHGCHIYLEPRHFASSIS